MAYQPQGSESAFLDKFIRRQREIEDYKRRQGGDLEGAYQKVTGEPWPKGRSVKVKGGVPEMTKDRTVKSVLGKYVAGPAALGATAVFAPGALPAVGKAALGTVTGAGKSAIAGGVKSAVGGGVKSAIGKWGSRLAPILGAAASRRAQSQQAQEAANIARDRQALAAYETGLEAPSKRLATSVGASRIARGQPVTAQWGGPGAGLRGGVTRFTGGYNDPNLVAPETRALGEDIVHQQFLEGMGDQGGPPAPMPPTGGGFWDTALGAGSTITSLMGALSRDDAEQEAPADYGYPPPRSKDPWRNVRF